MVPSWKAVLERRNEFVGGRLDHVTRGGGRTSLLIIGMRNLFGNGVCLMLAKPGTPEGVIMCIKGAAKIVLHRRGRVRVNVGDSYVAMVPGWHPRVTRDA